MLHTQRKVIGQDARPMLPLVLSPLRRQMCNTDREGEVEGGKRAQVVRALLNSVNYFPPAGSVFTLLSEPAVK